MHLEDGVLQALIDSELDSTAATEAQRHIESCVECRARFHATSQDDALLRRVLPALDHSLARIPATQVIARSRHAGRPLVRWAAVIALIVLGAGGLYAIPGSPLRRWVDHLMAKPAPASETRADSGITTGIALPPGDHFRIVFASPAPSRTAIGMVTIGFTDDSVVAVRRIRGAARFVAEIDGVRVVATGPADFAVGIPRLAPWVAVLVGDRRLFLKDGTSVITDVQPDSLGRYAVRIPGR